MQSTSFFHANFGSEKDAYVFLHGFPGRFTKNEDLAVSIAAKLRADCFVVQFPGSGEAKEEFLFTKCIGALKRYLEALDAQKRYRAIHVVAHSWGAFCAISVLEDLSFQIKSLTLLAPLLIVPPLEPMLGDLQDFVANQMALGYPTDLERLMADFQKIEEVFGPKVSNPIFSLWPKTLVVQGLEDQVTPAAIAREYFAKSTGEVTYVEYSDNHWLTDRKRLHSVVLEYHQENL